MVCCGGSLPSGVGAALLYSDSTSQLGLGLRLTLTLTLLILLIPLAPPLRGAHSSHGPLLFSSGTLGRFNQRWSVLITQLLQKLWKPLKMQEGKEAAIMVPEQLQSH